MDSLNGISLNILEALQLNEIVKLLVASQDMRPFIRMGIMKKWQQYWSNIQEIAAKLLREINPEIGSWKSGCSLSSFTETRIVRLWVGTYT